MKLKRDSNIRMRRVQIFKVCFDISYQDYLINPRFFLNFVLSFSLFHLYTEFSFLMRFYYILGLLCLLFYLFNDDEGRERMTLIVIYLIPS